MSTTVTLHFEQQPSLMIDVEQAAQKLGLTPEHFLVELISNHFKSVRQERKNLPERLRKLRGSLASLKQMDLSGDERAQKIIKE